MEGNALKEAVRTLRYFPLVKHRHSLVLQPSELQGEISEKSQVLLGKERFKEEIVSVIVTAFKTVSFPAKF